MHNVIHCKRYHFFTCQIGKYKTNNYTSCWGGLDKQPFPHIFHGRENWFNFCGKHFSKIGQNTYTFWPINSSNANFSYNNIHNLWYFTQNRIHYSIPACTYLVLRLWKQPQHVPCAQSCSTLCDPTDCNLPGSSVDGIFQTRLLERLAISFSRGSSPPRDRTCISCVSCIPDGFFTHWAVREALHLHVHN